MKTIRRTAWMVVFCIHINPVFLHPADAHPATEPFEKAKQAHDEGRFSDAIALYQSILEQGYISDALLFNLGNAYYRLGEPGRAVLYYSRASYLNPADPDITYNLGFVQKTAGALSEDPGTYRRLAGRFTLSTWIGWGIAFYWLACFGLGWSWIARRGAILWRRLSLLLFLALIVTGAGAAHWISLSIHPEVVVTEKDQEALFAPLDGATAHFTAPQGTVGRQLDRRNGWILVSVDENRGWLKESSLEAVYPLY